MSMHWNFIKTNWFSLAIVLLLLVALFRNGFKGPIQHFLVGGNGNAIEKLTEHPMETTLGLAVAHTEEPLPPAAVDQATSTAFLKRFAAVAVSERKKFGIPASILLASAFLNSHAGLQPAGQKANNFFELPCTGDWEGETATVGSRCVRKYETPWASWRDYSIYLTTREWFGAVHKASGKDWKKWTKSLEGKDISSIANFNEKLEEVIVYYRLYDLDHR